MDKSKSTQVSDLNILCENGSVGLGYTENAFLAKSALVKLQSEALGRDEDGYPHYGDSDAERNGPGGGDTYWNQDEISNRYVMRVTGLVYFETKGDGEAARSNAIVLTQQVFTVFGTGVDQQTGKPSLVLMFPRDGKTHSLAIPRGVLASGDSKMAEYLEDNGFRLSGDPRAPKLLRRCLMELKGPQVDIVAQPGWRDTGGGIVFIHPLGAFGANHDTPRVYFDSKRFRHLKVGMRGSHPAWIKSVIEPARGNSRMLFALSAALASPLLHFTSSVNSTMFNLYGQSSKGKSTIQIAAGSVHGGGGDREDKLGFAFNWNATPNALPHWAATHTHIFGCLDETPTDPDNAAAVVNFAYNFSSGQDKLRLDKEARAKDQLRWELVALSSAEHPLADMISKRSMKTGVMPEGAQARVIDVPAVVSSKLGAFETIHDFKSPEKFANALKSASRQNYGQAGQHFIACLVGDVNEDGEDVFRSYLSNLMAEFRAELDLQAASSIVRRVADAFALVCAAGRLAVQFKTFGKHIKESEITDACLKTFNAWVAARGGVHSKAEAFGIVKLRDYVQKNVGRFVAFNPTGKSTVTVDGQDINVALSRVPAFAGYKSTHRFFMTTSAFEDEVAGGKASADTLAKKLHALGLLHTQPSEAPRFTVKTVSPSPTRMYSIHKNILLVSDDGGLSDE